MNAWKHFSGCLMLVLSMFVLQSSQAEVPKPTFPDVFQVEVEGIFVDRNVEVDGSMFYDKTNNRAAMRFLYQGVRQTLIYNFNEDEFLQIEGNSCTASKIDLNEGPLFFPFTQKDNKKIIGSPEEVLYFTNAKLDRQDLSLFPSYVFASTQDFPMYGRTGCDVTHVFSKPELELPDCDNHACKSILVSISVQCPAIDEDRPLMQHTYNFFRFKKGADPEMFQAPAGTHCDTRSTSANKDFPELPQYFSFSYDINEYNADEDETGVNAIRKKIWYDSKLNLIRLDEFDNDGLISSSRILDFYGGTLYMIISSLSECLIGPLQENVALDQLTRLPKIFFDKTLADYVVYVGQRKTEGVYYHVWSSSYVDDKTDAKIVQEFHFNKVLINDDDLDNFKLHISHINMYVYERNDKTGVFELSVLSRLTVSNFRSTPKDWESFDVSTCFTDDQKVGFKLKVEGPATVKESRTYEEILEKMYMRLIITTNVSVIRINELTGVFDGVHVSEFTGWILNKTQTENSETGRLEPDMHTAYRMIEDAATAGKLTLKFKKDGKDLRYVVTAIEDVPVPKPQNKKKDCFSGGSMAAASLVLLVLGFSFGVVGYYVFLKKRRPTLSDDKIQLHMK